MQEKLPPIVPDELPTKRFDPLAKLKIKNEHRSDPVTGRPIPTKGEIVQELQRRGISVPSQRHKR